MAFRMVSSTDDAVPVSLMLVIQSLNPPTTSAIIGTTVSLMNSPNCIRIGINASPRVC